MKPISGKALCKIVEHIGFFLARQTGSHKQYVHVDGRRATIPVHGNDEIGPGLLLKILKQLKLSRDDFDRLR